jgi:hypothetical protein
LGLSTVLSTRVFGSCSAFFLLPTSENFKLIHYRGSHPLRGTHKFCPQLASEPFMQLFCARAGGPLLSHEKPEGAPFLAFFARSGACPSTGIYSRRLVIRARKGGPAPGTHYEQEYVCRCWHLDTTLDGRDEDRSWASYPSRSPQVFWR